MMLSPERVRRTIVRLAYEIIESNRGSGNLVVFGILNGGAELARVLGGYIEENLEEGRRQCSVNTLDVTRFRDDRDREGGDSSFVEPGVDVANKHVVLVDDVLFTGRTARAAIDAVIQLGRPKTIQLAVLVDRGHREYPIEPTFVGRTIKTKHKERVVVDVNDGFSIYVEE